jgi:hypothetical protein
VAWDDLDHGRPARFGGRHRTARGVSSEAPGRRGGRAGAYLVETSPQEAIALLYSALGRRSTPSAPPGRLEWTYVSTPSTFTGWRERSGREQGPQRRPSGAGFARTGGSFRRSDRSSPDTGQPMTTSEWLDRLTPKATAVLAVGTCAEARGDPITRRRSTSGRLPEGTGTAMRLASYGRPTRVSAREARSAICQEHSGAWSGIGAGDESSHLSPATAEVCARDVATHVPQRKAMAAGDGRLSRRPVSGRAASLLQWGRHTTSGSIYGGAGARCFT